MSEGLVAAILGPTATGKSALSLTLADRFGGEIVREAAARALRPARRKAMLIRFSRAAAGRLQALLDPVL